jgi:hypothetical protein
MAPDSVWRPILGIAVFGGASVFVAITLLTDPGGGTVARVLGGAAVLACAAMAGLGVISLFRLRSRRRT